MASDDDIQTGDLVQQYRTKTREYIQAQEAKDDKRIDCLMGELDRIWLSGTFEQREAMNEISVIP